MTPGRPSIARTILSGLGIVLSILLAFAIDAAWEERADRRQEAALLDGLRVEFEENLSQLDRMAAGFRYQDSVLVAFFDEETPETEEAARVVVEGFSPALMWADQFDANMASFEIMVNAGRLDLPTDAELRRLLWIWKRQVEDAEDDVGAFSQFILEGRRILGDLGARGIRTELRPSWREQVDRIRASHEVSALAQTVRYDRTEYSDELEVLRGTAREIIERLDRVDGGLD